jgi:uncharacterized protein DUF4345
MSLWIRRSIWLSRFILGAAALLLIRIGLRYVLDPLGEAAVHQVTLGSPEAITNTRVEGSIFVGIAVALAACIFSERRLRAGLAFFATIITTITVVRLFGLAADGPAPFTMKVLKPEVVLTVLSILAFFLEQRRWRGPSHQTIIQSVPVTNAAEASRCLSASDIKLRSP